MTGVGAREAQDQVRWAGDLTEAKKGPPGHLPLLRDWMHTCSVPHWS